ncbi:MAG: GAF domain-containing protein [Myxococcota bacterium]
MAPLTEDQSDLLAALDRLDRRALEDASPEAVAASAGTILRTPALDDGWRDVVAGRIAHAVATARLARDRRHLEILNEIARIASEDLHLGPMLQRITDAMRRKFGWEFAACIFIDHEAGRFTCQAVSSAVPTDVYVGYGRELGSGVVGEVAATGRALLLDDVREHPNYVETLPGALSELCVPVKTGGRVVALLNLESTRLGAFRDQVEVLEQVAEQIAGAIANARVHAELRRRTAHLEMIGEMSRAALEASDLAGLLERIAWALYERLGMSVVAIALWHEETREFELAAHVGDVPLNVGIGKRWTAGEGICGRAIRTRATQVVTDVRSDPSYIAMNEDVVAECVAPIQHGGRVLGVLNLESIDADAFPRETVQMLETVADQLAGAVAAARGRG